MALPLSLRIRGRTRDQVAELVKLGDARGIVSPEFTEYGFSGWSLRSRRRPVALGRMDERMGRITDQEHVLPMSLEAGLICYLSPRPLI